MLQSNHWALSGLFSLGGTNKMVGSCIAMTSNTVRGLTRIALATIAVVTAADPASTAPCAFEPQGEGRVTAALDARSFRLEDGREVRLAGIEPAALEKSPAELAGALASIVAGHEVRLRGEDDSPDRYGRQLAFAWLVPEETLVQGELLAQGRAVVSATVIDRDCAATLMAAEAKAREAKKGIWADPAAIKNTESSGDILAGIGRFRLVEGKVLSVRQAGATTYLNFGRNWTRDFAVTIPRRALANLAAAGLVPKSLENKRIRVRGFVEMRTGPRIEVVRAGQIELLGEN
jgi:endonuclease YncB( thermonuclease family)